MYFSFARVWIAGITFGYLAYFSTIAAADEPVAKLENHRQYWIDATLFSYKIDEGLKSHNGGGGGGVAPFGTLSLGFGGNDRRFNVKITCEHKSNRFTAKVSVEPAKGDMRTEAREFDLDLSDLRAQSVEITKDDDGRIYRLNLTPKVNEYPLPENFRAEDLRLDTFAFPSSPVVMNDQIYLGRLSASYGALVHFDVPGFARVEFSLHEITEGKPWGSLQNGTIDIVNPDGTTIRITDVKNGTQRNVLQGGPWRVWVRWKESSMTVEEYHAVLRNQLEMLREREKNGAILSPGALKSVEKNLASDHPGIASFGLGPVSLKDLIKPGDKK